MLGDLSAINNSGVADSRKVLWLGTGYCVLSGAKEYHHIPTIRGRPKSRLTVVKGMECILSC